MPLPERIARAWRHDVWGRAIDARAAGGLLKLTDALPHKTGWAEHTANPDPDPEPEPVPEPDPDPDPEP